MRRLLLLLILLPTAACQIPGFGDRDGEGAEGDSVAIAAGDSVAGPDSLSAQDSTAVEALEAPVEGDTLAVLLAEIRSLSERVDALTPDSSAVAEVVPDGLFSDVNHLGFRIFLAFVTLAIAWVGIRLIAFVMEGLAERMVARRLLVKRLIPVVRIIAWTLAILFVVRVVLDLDANALFAAGAAAGVAVGFAAQDVLKNIFGGLIVILDQPFQVGDKVSVAGTYGEVVNIGLRSTKIVTPDDNLVTVPNAQIVDGQVANANAGELNCQVVTHLFLPGRADEARARELAYEAAVSSEFVYLKKPVVVLVEDMFKETFLLKVIVKAYVLDPRLEFMFKSDVTERARAAYREAGLLGDDQRFGEERSTPVVRS